MNDAATWHRVGLAALNLRKEAERRGIESDRIVFAPRLPYPEHLARIPLTDLALDTFPFNGGATTSDVLWAGVPVLTCAGEAFASRMTGSLLRALELPELITRDLEEYARIGIALQQPPHDLRSLRSRLDVSLRTTTAFDGAGNAGSSKPHSSRCAPQAGSHHARPPRALLCGCSVIHSSDMRLRRASLQWRRFQLVLT